jgi:hypothetical protein
MLAHIDSLRCGTALLRMCHTAMTPTVNARTNIEFIISSRRINAQDGSARMRSPQSLNEFMQINRFSQVGTEPPVYEAAP